MPQRVGLDHLGVDPAVLLEVLAEVLPVLPLAARVAVAETGHLVVGLEPVFQTVVVMVGTGRVAGDIGPRAVGIALLLDSLEDEAVDVVVELRVGRRLDAALGKPVPPEAPGTRGCC